MVHKLLRGLAGGMFEGDLTDMCDGGISETVKCVKTGSDDLHQREWKLCLFHNKIHVCPLLFHPKEAKQPHCNTYFMHLFI